MISGLELNYVQENDNGLKEYKMQFLIKNIEIEKDEINKLLEGRKYYFHC